MDENREDGPEDAEVVDAGWVRRRVVRHEEPEKGENEVLEAKRDPVDCAPGGIVCDSAGKETSEEQAHHETGDNDGQGRGPAVGGCKVTDQREHCSPVVSLQCENMGSHGINVLNWGVTVVKDVRKVRKQKMAKEFVRQSPSLNPTMIRQCYADP